MDISLISIDQKTNRLEFAGAHNSLYLVRAGELMELKADKMGLVQISRRINFSIIRGFSYGHRFVN
jgi:hypothetical protein